jgi:hypothetical protein
MGFQVGDKVRLKAEYNPSGYSPNPIATVTGVFLTKDPSGNQLSVLWHSPDRLKFNNIDVTYAECSFEPANQLYTPLFSLEEITEWTSR